MVKWPFYCLLKFFFYQHTHIFITWLEAQFKNHKIVVPNSTLSKPEVVIKFSTSVDFLILPLVSQYFLKNKNFCIHILIIDSYF